MRKPLYEWQREAIQAWRAAGSAGVVEAVTGTGKTRVAVELIREELDGGGKALVLVPTLALLSQWQRELRSSLGVPVGQCGDGTRASFRKYEVIVATPISARKNTGFFGSQGLLVADECHRYGAPTWSQALDERFPRRLGLTATYAREDNGNVEFLDPYFGWNGPIFRIGFGKAIRQGVVAPFKVAMVAVKFPAEDAVAYEAYREQAGKARYVLIEHFGLPSEPFGEFMKAVQAAANGECEEGAQVKAWAYLQGFSHCRQLLADTRVKRVRALELADALETANGTLIFTQTKLAARQVASEFAQLGFATAAIYSDIGRDEREHILRGFERGSTELVSAPRVLDEGIDVPDADLAIVMASSSSRRQMIQRMGRVLRKSQKNPEKIARLVVLYVQGTVEDPEDGAHQDFLDEILPVAEEVRVFQPDADPAAITEWLKGRSAERSSRAHR